MACVYTELFLSFSLFSDMVKAGKWAMSVRWQMRGVQIDCDAGVGKRLSSLAQTLTFLAGEPDIADIESVTDVQEKGTTEPGCGQDEVDAGEKGQVKRNTRNVEKEMWEQARKVNELRYELTAKVCTHHHCDAIMCGHLKFNLKGAVSATPLFLFTSGNAIN